MPHGQKNPKTDDDDGRAQRPQENGGGSSKRRAGAQPKRRCVSSACIACRKRKSKCDGNTPSCAACSSVYFSECIYDPSSDHRRKTSVKKDSDSLKTRNSTLQTLLQAILTYPEDEVYQLVQDIRRAENLDELATEIAAKERNAAKAERNVIPEELDNEPDGFSDVESPDLEADISGKMASLQIDSDGQIRSYGATSLLGFLSYQQDRDENDRSPSGHLDGIFQPEDPITSWTSVTKDKELIVHLINMYFTWHYPYFTTLSKNLFFRDFLKGKPRSKTAQANSYCSSLLVHAMMALGCHFTARPEARSDPANPATAGNQFFNEAKRLILENDEHENPRLTTVQALGLMSVREAGCGREARGWVYSGMSFRMACDLGLHVNPDTLAGRGGMSDEEIDARKVTLWGVFLFDKCWSNYMGRMPQLPSSIITCPKCDVFPDEDSQIWSPYTDNGLTTELSQPARTRAVSLQISALCEISNDVLLGFYVPTNGGTSNEARFKKGERDNEMKRLVGLHARLEEWNRKLPVEMEAKEGALPNVLLMHMFCQLLYLLLFRPFLKLGPSGNTAFPSHLQPRKMCTIAATTISKYLRIYKRTYGLKQICNVVVYIGLSACTVHLINLPTKAAKRDIIQGVKSLEEMADYWLCAKRALIILKILANKYELELPEEAEEVLTRMNSQGEMFGFRPQDLRSPPKTRSNTASQAASPSPKAPPAVAAATPNTQLTDDILRQFEAQSPDFLMLTGTQSGAGNPSLNSVSSLFTPYFDPGSSPSNHSQDPRSQQPSMMPSPNMQMPSYVPSTSNAPASSSAAPMYGGLDHLVDQSQQWWLKDQVQLAMDFGQEWPGQAYSPPVSMGDNSEHSGEGFMNFNPNMDTSSSGNVESNNGSPWP